MPEKYVKSYPNLEERYAMLIEDVEQQIRIAGGALLAAAGMPSFEIDLVSQCLTVGEYDPVICGSPALYSIFIEQEAISVLLEIYEEHQPLFDIETIDLYDKISILAVIENQIDELQ